MYWKMCSDVGVSCGQSVTGRVRITKQPIGGFVRPKWFEKTELSSKDLPELYEKENVAPSVVGTCVDALTRLMTGTPKEKVFAVSQRGALLTDEMPLFERLFAKVTGLDDVSIYSAARLVGFDTAYRAGLQSYVPVRYIQPDVPTIENIRTMVKRALRFFEQYGESVSSGLMFEGGYTPTVSAGDGDFLTKDALWDFKVSKSRLQPRQTLQLLIYWRMGLHSIHEEYQNVKYLGVYNPRQNVVYRLAVTQIPQDVIDTVETDVIGY